VLSLSSLEGSALPAVAVDAWLEGRLGEDMPIRRDEMRLTWAFAEERRGYIGIHVCFGAEIA
jgi:hypothetical protein